MTDAQTAAQGQARADLEAGARFVCRASDYSIRPVSVWQLRDLRDHILGWGAGRGFVIGDADLLDRLLAGELEAAELSTGDCYERRPPVTPLVSLG